MRALTTVIVLSLAACFAKLGAQGPVTDAARILDASREALGGGQKLASVKTFIATGRTQQVRGDNLVPIEFEIACELPDKYVRRSEVPAQETGVTSAGFNGNRLIQLPLPAARSQVAGSATKLSAEASASKGSGAAAAPAAARGGAGSRDSALMTQKEDFIKLTLGMFASSFGAAPLTFTRLGQAEAPQGTADVIDVKSDGVLLRFFIDTQTRLPLMVSWNVPAPQAAAPPAPAAAAGPGQAAAAAKLVEHRIYYADYRDIGNGIRFPFRLRRAVAGQTVEETTFDGFRINARIDPRKFEPR